MFVPLTCLFALVYIFIPRYFSLYFRNLGGELFSSAKVRLCGSWAANLATRASDVNFTVLLQPNSLFAMLDAKVCVANGMTYMQEMSHAPSRPFTRSISL